MRHKKKVLQALLNNPTVAKAAKACGLSETTIYKYLKNPEFRAEYEEIKKQIFDETLDYIKSRAVKASEVLDDLIDNPTVSPRINMETSMYVIDKAFEIDDRRNWQERVKELEERIEQGNN
jgi:AcrR family transcriptional regulator